MRSFELQKLIAEMDAAGHVWREFLRLPALSMGVYRLAAGQEDRQQPHTEDEVYYVIGGRAMFRAGGEECQVQAGAVLFVEKNVEHRFTAITEDLTVLVFFAPTASTSRTRSVVSTWPALRRCQTARAKSTSVKSRLGRGSRRHHLVCEPAF